MLTSTFLTLFVVPVVYILMSPRAGQTARDTLPLTLAAEEK